MHNPLIFWRLTSSTFTGIEFISATLKTLMEQFYMLASLKNSWGTCHLLMIRNRSAWKEWEVPYQVYIDDADGELEKISRSKGNTRNRKYLGRILWDLEMPHF